MCSLEGQDEVKPIPNPAVLLNASFYSNRKPFFVCRGSGGSWFGILGENSVKQGFHIQSHSKLIFWLKASFLQNELYNEDLELILGASRRVPIVLLWRNAYNAILKFCSIKMQLTEVDANCIILYGTPSIF